MKRDQTQSTHKITSRSNPAFLHRVVLICCALMAAWVVYFPLTNTDIWWHLAAGREIVRRKAFLYTDPFAFTPSDAQWIDLHWLFQLGTYLLHSIGGVSLLVWTKLLTIFGTVITLSFARADRRYKFFCAALMTILLYQARYLVLMRPILITIIAIVSFIVILERYARTRKRRSLLWLIPIQIVWTNSQGLFILGPLILGCYWLGELIKTLFGRPDGLQDRKTVGFHIGLTVALILVSFATLVNPYGMDGVLFPFKLFLRIDPSHANIYSRNISENIPLMSLQGVDKRYMYAVFSLTAITLVSFFVNRKKTRWSHVLLFGAFFSLAYMAKRNILLYFVVVAPILASNLADWSSGFNRQKQWGKILGSVLSGILIAAVVLSAFTHARVVRHYPSKTMISPFRIPDGAVRFLAQNPAPGALFNSIRYGGYLIWKLYPSQEVFIDGRLIIRSPQFFADYLAVCGNPADNFPALARRFAITQVLLPTAVFYQSMPLVKYLYEQKPWEVVYADGASILFRYRKLSDEKNIIDLSSEQQVGKILTAIKQNWSDDPLIQRQHEEGVEGLLRYLGVTP